LQRSLGLDIVRSIAILLVMTGHGIDIIYPFVGEFAGNLIHQQFGHLGVQLFFVLSGYLIGRILIKTYKGKGFGAKAIVHFWLRRWFRTIPNYLLFLIIYICIGLCYTSKVGHWNFELDHSKPLYYYPFFLQNFLTPINSFFSQSWSLTIEEWFYLTLPLFFSSRCD
jgi:peptidoglycan/LPS O-acetylase OafA/YrhL